MNVKLANISTNTNPSVNDFSDMEFDLKIDGDELILIYRALRPVAEELEDDLSEMFSERLTSDNWMFERLTSEIALLNRVSLRLRRLAEPAGLLMLLEQNSD